MDRVSCTLPRSALITLLPSPDGLLLPPLPLIPLIALSALQQECKSGRKVQSELGYTLDMNQRIRHLADIETKKARDAETAREKESTRVRLLERRVEK